MSDSLRPHGLQPAKLLCPADFPGKTTGVDGLFLPHGMFPTQGSNPRPLRWQAGSLPLSHLEKEFSLLRQVFHLLPQVEEEQFLPLSWSIASWRLCLSSDTAGKGQLTVHTDPTPHGSVLQPSPPPASCTSGSSLLALGLPVFSPGNL